MSHNRRIPSQATREAHAKVALPMHKRLKPPPKLDAHSARARAVRHAIEDLMIERELGLSGDGK